jgi:hypothetical protein
MRIKLLKFAFNFWNFSSHTGSKVSTINCTVNLSLVYVAAELSFQLTVVQILARSVTQRDCALALCLTCGL